MTGNFDHADFDEALELLAGEAELTRRSDSAEPPSSWDLLLVCQSRPGSVLQESLAQLCGRNPLAGQIVLLGSWCEGETRTGRPLADLERLFWYQFPSWWKRTIDAWSQGRPTDWHSPFPQVILPPRELHAAAQGPVAIVSPDYSSASTLIDLCEAVGREAYWCPRDASWPVMPPPAAGIWCGGMLDEGEEASLRHTSERLAPEAPLLVLLDFPRREAVAAARRMGASAILGKPWRADQLLAALRPQSGKAAN